MASHPALLALALAAAAGTARAQPPAPGAAEIALVNRITFGVNAESAADIARLGPDRWLERQLRPQADDHLPPAAEAEIDALPISHTSLIELAAEQQARNEAKAQIADPAQKHAAEMAYQQWMSDVARQARTRELLRDLYSPDQLQEQMTWFWFNHFNVHADKQNIRVMVGDYEDQAIRPHALGRFRDLLEATLRHPAMLRYLDNADNAVGRVNENYARELLELHTMGVGSGYTQKDVQELARILTGVGIDLRRQDPHVRPQLRSQLIRQGLFVFNPNRHDYGDKILLGHSIRGAGFSEVEQALDILAREPATARHVSREIAVYFVGDAPPQSLVDRMAGSFQRNDGDIAEVLRTLFHSPEFKASLGKDFKDPVRYAVSAVRLAYGDRVVLNTQPIQGWLHRMGEGLYGHETPDGYSMASAAWSGPGQMAIRFEIARQIGAGAAGLFKPDAAAAAEKPGYPQLQNALYYQALSQRLAAPTRAALDQAVSPEDWNALYLSSPEFMRR